MGSAAVLWLGTVVALGDAVAWLELAGCRSAALPKPPATAVAAAATPTSATPPATSQRRGLMPMAASPMPAMRRASGSTTSRVRGMSASADGVGMSGESAAWAARKAR